MIEIKELKVKNFKSLVDVHINDFGKVNMFYGFNNSGKSNVFKFLSMLFSRKIESQKVEIIDDSQSVLPTVTPDKLINQVNFWDGRIYDEPFIFSNNDRSKNIEFEVKILLSNSLIPGLDLLKENGYISDNEETEIVIIGEIKEINSKNSYLTVSSANLNKKNFHVIEDGITFGFKDLDVQGLDNKLSEKILNILNDCVEFIDTDRNFNDEIFNNGLNTLNHKNFKNWLFELNINAEKNDTFQELAKFLSKFEFSAKGKEKLNTNINSFPFRQFTDIGFTRFGNNIEIMLKNKDNRLPLSSFGTGIQQFFFILTKIFMNESRIIIIEEIELNLSVLYQRELMIFLKTIMGDKFDQLLFSSHSPFFTLKDSNLIDVVQHVQIGNAVHDNGTTVESHTDLVYDEQTEQSFFSLLYS